MHDALVKARRFITDKRKWTHGSEARNSSGQEVSTEDESAVTFCAIGAIRHTSGLDNHGVRDVCNEVRKHHGAPIHQINDFDGHERVLSALDESIAYIAREIGL